ncbi:MAG TPA: GTP 3',8-cyclase MoaA [Dehalococcoidia bacterium]|jgi:cyclic pyranopterin phosphate synthase|nr:GTP 3',8-cyclase MoaA [Dehalococcoidia bacterium]|tara:strand:+ start:438 stop:1454 length:1017 start_codon:yes stop_codon:yes gene_type:complete
MDIVDTFNRPLKDLRISVTDKCNFRCPYCMPKETFGVAYKFLPKEEILTFEEISRLANIFSTLGVTKLRLTGGEPLLRANISDLIKMLSTISNITDIAMTTNAYLLKSQAKLLKDAGLNRITISLDSLDEEVFGKMNGRGFSVSSVLEGIEAAKTVELTPIKINCVVQKGVNDHTILELSKYCKSNGYTLRFIEYMDVGNQNHWNQNEVLSGEDIIHILNQELPIVPIDKNYPGEVANRYKYTDGEGEIGIICSVTQPFCSQCSRARLSTDGKLVTCLFASGGIDLRDMLRTGGTDQQIYDLISKTWGNRKDRYSEERSTFKNDDNQKPKIEMFHIGG